MIENFAPFFLFVLVMVSTPGPGNLTFMAVGQTAGFRRALPLLAATVVSAGLIDMAVGFGLGNVFTAAPKLEAVFKAFGFLYIVYLGVKILRMRLGANPEKVDITFIEGFLIHPTSPKTWAMSVVGFSQFSSPTEPLVPQVAIFVLTFMAVQIVCHSVWCVVGAFFARILRVPAAMNAFNIVSVGLMLSSAAFAMYT